MPVRRVAELLAAAELLGQEAGDVVPRREENGARVRLERLDDDAARRGAAAPPGELGDQLERALLGAEVRHREARVGVDDGGERHVSEVMALRHHLRSEQHGAVGGGEALERLLERRGARDGVRVEPDPLQARHVLLELALEALRAGADADELGRAAGRAELARGLRARRSGGSGATRRAWSTSATSHARQRRVSPQSRQWSAGTSPRRFRSRIALPPSRSTRASSASSGAESG